MEKVLIIGANGFLGNCSLKRFQLTHKVFAADISIDMIGKEFNPIMMDITKDLEVSNIFSRIKPDLTILTAAMTNVDSCEELPEKAKQINVIGPKLVAGNVRKTNSKLIHISTDYVFDGKNGNYSENDSPNPINVYGQSKLDGEYNVIDAGITYLICRTSVLFGWPIKSQHENFFSWTYNQLSNQKTVKIVKDQINSPTLIDDLSECLHKMSSFSKSGIYHTCGREIINRYDFVKKLIHTFDFQEDLLEEAKSFVQKAKRPFDVSLNNAKVEKIFDFKFQDVTQSFNFLKNKKGNRNFLKIMGFLKEIKTKLKKF